VSINKYTSITFAIPLSQVSSTRSTQNKKFQGNSNIAKDFSAYMRSCPCGLTKDEVQFLHCENQVLLVGGKCQNPLADGSDGVCGKALGAHPSSQGNFNYKTVLSFNYRSGTNMLLLVFLFRKRGGFTETDRGFTETSSRG
jgi:hypothetical protein